MLGKEIAAILQEINPMIVKNFHSSHEIDLKPDESIVTKTDREVEKVLIPKLKELLPDSEIVGEESASTGSEDVDKYFQSEYLWAVDPIDGTVNFASGLPLFTVSIGLLQRNDDGYSPLTGVISFPMFSQIYYTDDEKTFLWDISSNNESVVIRTNNKAITNLLVPNHSVVGKKLDYQNRFASNVRLLGSTAIDLLYVSIGKASATITIAHIWDIAGALAIAKTQNLSPRDFKTGQEKRFFTKDDFLFGKPKEHWRLKKHIVLCEEEYFSDVQELLKN